VQSEQILAGSTITFLRRVSLSRARTYTYVRAYLFIYAAQRKLWVQLAAALKASAGDVRTRTFACSAAKHLSRGARGKACAAFWCSVKITCMELCQ